MRSRILAIAVILLTAVGRILSAPAQGGSVRQPPPLAVEPRELRRDAPARQNVGGGADETRGAALRVGLTRPGGGYTIATIPLETYVARVLAGEAARESPPAALEALAITVRTYALANRSRHRADGFDVCDETHCQVLRPATAATERAAEATAGRVLLYRGAVASVY